MKIRPFAAALFCALIACGAAAETEPRELAPEQKTRLEAWVRSMGDAEFQKREAAQKQLEEWLRDNEPLEEAAAGFLKELGRKGNDPEIQARIQSAVDRATADKPKGFLGIHLGAPIDDAEREALGLKPGETGARLAGVTPEYPAEKAGLKEGDVILQVDGKPIEGSDHLAQRIAALKPGRQVVLQVLREKKRLEIKLALARRPDSDPIQ